MQFKLYILSTISNVDKLEISCLGINEKEYFLSTGSQSFTKLIINILNLKELLLNNKSKTHFHVSTYALNTIKSTDQQINNFWENLGIELLGPMSIVNRGGFLKNYNHKRKPVDNSICIGRFRTSHQGSKCTENPVWGP